MLCCAVLEGVSEAELDQTEEEEGGIVSQRQTEIGRTEQSADDDDGKEWQCSSGRG